MLTAVSITLDGKFVWHTDDLSLEFLQGRVDGQVQVVDAYDPFPFSMWCNEDGKAMGLQRNDVATILAEACDVGLMPDDYLAGTVVLTGQADRQGDTQPFGPQLAMWITDLAVA